MEAALGAKEGVQEGFTLSFFQDQVLTDVNISGSRLMISVLSVNNFVYTNMKVNSPFPLLLVNHLREKKNLSFVSFIYLFLAFILSVVLGISGKSFEQDMLKCFHIQMIQAWKSEDK